MGEKKVTALALICVILAMGVAGAVLALNMKYSEAQSKDEQISDLENEKNALETQVSSVQNETAALQAQVETLESEKQVLETQVVNLQNTTDTLEEQTETLQEEKQTLETQVTELENETETLEAQVGTLQNEVDSLETEVTESYDQGYVEGESDGYETGYDEGYDQGIEDVTEGGWYFVDPTFAEMDAFIEADKTDENDYNQSYVCYDFTADVIANAQEQGYRCGFVYIEYATSAHAVVCFNTTDFGLIYVEPQNDQIISIAVGQFYLGEIILKIGIIW